MVRCCVVWCYDAVLCCDVVQLFVVSRDVLYCSVLGYVVLRCDMVHVVWCR